MKIAVGLSGGVDSSVVALILKRTGYDVIGVHMKRIGTGGGGVNAQQDEADASQVAKLLDIPFVVVDFRSIYREKVISRFLEDFQKGLTPNPDVWCNEIMKFGLFLDYAMNELGADKIATGHYARVSNELDQNMYPGMGNINKGPYLLSGIDKGKDQSYFLYRLSQEQLSKSIFPLGELTKDKVRNLAKQAGLPTANKKDSVGVCFIGDIDMREYLRQHLDLKPGVVKDVKGEVIGTHEGVQLYTIGQRHGFNITKYQGIPLYVVEKDVNNNVLIVGRDAVSDVYMFDIVDARLTSESFSKLLSSDELKVRVRHLGRMIPCSIEQELSGWKCLLREPDKGIADGQHAVVYLGDVVIGGGVIKRRARVGSDISD